LVGGDAHRVRSGARFRIGRLPSIDFRFGEKRSTWEGWQTSEATIMTFFSPHSQNAKATHRLSTISCVLEVGVDVFARGILSETHSRAVQADRRAQSRNFAFISHEATTDAH
jgi:hypothetical protein